MEIELPYPPSVNHYWRRVGARTIISKQGRAFRDEVIHLARGRGRLSGKLGVRIWVHPAADHRHGDLDNLLKAPLDAMQHAGLYQDDGQIDEIHLHRGQCIPGGCLRVDLWQQEGPQLCDTSDLKAELAKRAKELQSELESVLEALAAVS